MKPALTIILGTVNGQEKLNRILPGLRAIADQLVVGIDDTTTDESDAVARQFADTVFSIPHRCFMPDGSPSFVSGLELALPHCKGDWIMRLDHDETLSSGWQNQSEIEELLSDRYATHYWIPRRWVLPPGDRYISSSHWYPDYQMRLFRNDPSLITFTRIAHQPTGVQGEARFLTHLWLLHWDLLWHSRELRERKVQFYKTLGPYTGEEFYLYEEQQYETRPLGYIPPRSVFRAPAECSPAPLGCAIEFLEVPEIIRAGRMEHALLGVRNLSSRVFYPGSAVNNAANVRVSYHWLRDDGGVREVHSWDNPRFDLPCRLAPGESTVMYLPLRELPEPGRYWLQADLVEENVAWGSAFSDLPCRLVEVRAMEAWQL